MSTTTEITADELRDQIAGHKAVLGEAEREIGAAALDGTSTTAADKRARAARDGIAQCEAALEELKRREAEQAEREAEAAAAATLHQLYVWAAGVSPDGCRRCTGPQRPGGGR